MLGKNGPIGKVPFGTLLSEAPLRVLRGRARDSFCQPLAKPMEICRTLATPGARNEASRGIRDTTLDKGRGKA
jgi:hypothetical protein